MMKSQRQQRLGRMMRVSLVTGLLLIVLAAVFDFYYDLNDDTAIKDLLSGAYTGTPTGYTNQMLFPLGYFIALCYRAIPGVAWYGLFLCVCQFGVVWLLGCRLLHVTENKAWQYGILCLEMLVFAGCMLRPFVMLQYSVTSGLCMTAAIFLYVTGHTWREQIVPVILVLLSYQIRTEVCLLLMPFLLILGFFRLFLEEAVEETRAQIVKKNLIIFACAVGGMVLLSGLDAIAVRVVPEASSWQEYQRFFQARTRLYDYYRIPMYETHQAFYDSIGLTKESCELLANYNFALDERIDADTLEKIVDYIEKNPQICGIHKSFGLLYTKNSLSEGVWLYKDQIRNGKDGIWGILLCLSYLLLFCISTGQKGVKRWQCLLTLACFVVARSMIWIYLWMVDRMLDRILLPLYAGELFALLALIFVAIQKEKRYKVLLIGYLLCAVLTCSYGLVKQVKNTGEEYQSRVQINPRWESLISYCEGRREAFYLVDVYSSTSYAGIPYAEKVFAQGNSGYRNFDLCGGWVVKSPMHRAKLEESTIFSLEEDLLEEEKEIYFIAAPDHDMSWLLAYYASRGKAVLITQTDEITYQGETIYKVYEIRNGDTAS